MQAGRQAADASDLVPANLVRPRIHWSLCPHTQEHSSLSTEPLIYSGSRAQSPFTTAGTLATAVHLPDCAAVSQPRAVTDHVAEFHDGYLTRDPRGNDSPVLPVGGISRDDSFSVHKN